MNQANQARTTYQSDYTPFDWFQNNVLTDMEEFCSSDNVDECLKYISQEFSALGYPSIYSNSSDCPFAVNCDIVKFVNATYELLRRNSEHIQTKEDMRSRNQRLSSDLNVLNKKNSVLKATVEQTEKKFANALERERQLKEKNDQLSRLLKTEKDETKKLTSQIRQQKVVYQHEIRKYENNINQIKAKLNQLLSDKNPNKKIASITTSHTLSRNCGQRGKWKTESTATTAVEDMYSSIISTYETRSKDLYKELKSFRQCIQSVLLQILEIVSSLQNEMDSKTCSATSEEFVFNEMKKESRDVQSFEEKFKYLFCILKETVSKKSCNKEVNKNLEDEIANLKSKLSQYENIEKCKGSTQVDGTECTNSTDIPVNKDEISKSFSEEFIKKEKMKLEAEKIALSKSLENIEKEKAALTAQKVAILRLAIQQNVSSRPWHQALTTFPAISVMTSESGLRRISTASLLKSSLSAPEHIGEPSTSSSSQWTLGETDEFFDTKPSTILQKENASAVQSTVCDPLFSDIQFSDTDLPSWAVNRTEVQNIVPNDVQNSVLEASQNISADEIELLNESSSEEVNMLRLKAAMQDIKNRTKT